MDENRYEVPGVPVVLRRKALDQIWTARIKLPKGQSLDFGRIERGTGARDLNTAIAAAHRLYHQELSRPASGSALNLKKGQATFGQVAEEFIEHQHRSMNANLLKAASYQRNHIALRRHYLPLLGDKPIAEITLADLEQFLADRSLNTHLPKVREEIEYVRQGKKLSYYRPVSRASKETLRRERTAFIALMKYAVAHQYLREDQCPRFPSLPKGDERRSALDAGGMILLQETSIKRILATKNPLHRRQRLMCHLRMMWLYLTGMRPQEVALLRHGSLEAVKDRQGQQTIIIDLTKAERLKNKKHKREVVALPQLWPIATQTVFPGCGYGREDYLFCDSKRRPLGPSNKIFRALIEEVAEKAEMEMGWTTKSFDPNAPYYSMRHTFITERLNEGWDVHKVARHCGTSVEMIERYYSHSDSRSERLGPQITGPFVIPLPIEIWEAEATNKVGSPEKPTILDFEPEYRWEDDSDHSDELTPTEWKRWLEVSIEDAQSGIY